MANLILKSNTANKAFNIQQKVFKLPFDDNKVELIITPKKSYSINAKDFNVGLLPNHISKVEFDDLDDKVMAIIFMSRKINISKNIILDIPIYGKGFLKIDSFNIIEQVNVSKDILVGGSSSFTKSVIDNKTKYLIKNTLGKKSLVFSKTFTVTKGYKFLSQPTYTINEGSSKYDVVTKTKKDISNNIISKTFDFYYTSSKTLTSSKDTEISFSASSKSSSSQTYNKVATSVKENKIYSINKGKDPGAQGGIKKIVVKGVTGSTFELIVSNSDGKMYDTEKGTFSDSGSTIKGKIPIAIKGRNYGESVINIRIPRLGVAQTISTEFMKQEDPAVIKSKIQEGTVDITEIVTPIKTTKEKSLSLTIPTLTFGVTTTNYVGPKVKIISSGVTTTSTDIFLGEEGREVLKFTKPGAYRFNFTVSASAAHRLVRVTRQPLFVMPTAPDDNYVAWDSDETKKALAQKADGTEIPSDWDWSTVEENTNVEMKISCKGIGKSIEWTMADGNPCGDGAGPPCPAFARVQVSGEIRVGNVGEASSTLNLRLDNFLSVVNPAA
jgi:hypothetical protein